MGLFTQAELSRELHVSKAMIGKLVKQGKLIKGDNNKIDTETPHNKNHVDTMKANTNTRIQKFAGITKRDMGIVPSSYDAGLNDKAMADLELQREKVKQTKKQNELSDIKLATANKQLIDRDLIKKVISNTFGSFFDLLANQYPKNTADEIIDVVRADSENVRNILIEKITGDIRRLIEDGISQAESAVKNEFKKQEPFK